MVLANLQLFRLENPEQQTKILTRSSEQHTKLLDDNINLELEDVSVEEGLEDRTIQGSENCCVEFDAMLDSNQKLIHPYFTSGRHNDLDAY